MQSVVSHVSAEAEVISLDAELRREGLLAQQRESVTEVCSKPVSTSKNILCANQRSQLDDSKQRKLDDGPRPHLATLFVFEYNEAVLRMIIQGVRCLRPGCQ